MWIASTRRRAAPRSSRSSPTSSAATMCARVTGSSSGARKRRAGKPNAASCRKGERSERAACRLDFEEFPSHGPRRAVTDAHENARRCAPERAGASRRRHLTSPLHRGLASLVSASAGNQTSRGLAIAYSSIALREISIAGGWAGACSLRTRGRTALRRESRGNMTKPLLKTTAGWLNSSTR